MTINAYLLRPIDTGLAYGHHDGHEAPTGTCHHSTGSDPQMWDEHIPGETDRDRADRHADAIDICINDCPARQRCEQYAATTLGLSGVVAGHLIKWRIGDTT